MIKNLVYRIKRIINRDGRERKIRFLSLLKFFHIISDFERFHFEGSCRGQAENGIPSQTGSYHTTANGDGDYFLTGTETFIRNGQKWELVWDSYYHGNGWNFGDYTAYYVCVGEKYKTIKSILEELKTTGKWVASYYYLKQPFWGTKKVPDIIFKWEKGNLMMESINCYNGIEGTCACNSHETTIVETSNWQTLLRTIKGYIFENENSEKAREKASQEFDKIMEIVS